MCGNEVKQLRPILLGVFAAFFFAFTFIFNRAMELSGGSWLWSASLRYFFMVPFLVLIVLARKNFGTMWKVMKEQPGAWLWWSFVGFGLFYAPLCFAAAYSPGWLTAGTWQITIIAGTLLVPFITMTVHTKEGTIKVKGKIPMNALGMSLIILLGVVFMQLDQVHHFSITHVWLGIIPVVLAAFAYPLGNRKMMEVCAGRLDVYQRVLGMTLASLPFWIILSVIVLFTTGLPSQGQVSQSLLVALFSGVIATVLFFQATDLVRGNMQKLGAIEATQSLEVLFVLFGEIILLSAPIPSLLSWFGIVIVIFGMVLHSLMSHKADHRKDHLSDAM
jgi:drug/metabolite transporter (DMT)-like permease